MLLLVGIVAAASLIAGRSVWLSRVMSGRGASTKAGVAGFLNLTSGLSGPPLVGYAEAVRMPHLTFVASVQVVFIALDAVTIAWRGLPSLPPSDTVWLLVAMIAGVIITSLVARLIPQRRARLLMFAVAWLGTVVVILKGLFALGL